MRMDSPYDEPWEVGAGSEGGKAGDPSAGEVPTIVAVIVAETVIMSGLLFCLWSVSICHARLPVRLCRSCDCEEGLLVRTRRSRNAWLRFASHRAVHLIQRVLASEQAPAEGEDRSRVDAGGSAGRAAYPRAGSAADLPGGDLCDDWDVCWVRAVQ